MKKNALYWFLSGFSILILLGAKITTETLNIGNKTAEDIKIVFDIGQGASNPMVRWANSAGKIQFSNDGTNFFDMGSGEGGGTGINVVENGGFESGVTGWTASGSSAVAEVSAAANVAKGAKSGSWDATANAETLKSDIQLIPNALNAKACLASALYKWPTGTVGHIVARVEDNGTAVTSNLTLPPTSGTDWLPIQIAFTCVDGQQLSFVLEATADADILYLDEVHVGSDYRVGSVNDTAELVASIRYAATANCTWTRTNTALGGFGIDADCPAPTQIAGNYAATLSDSDFPIVTIPDLPAGDYVVQTTFSATAGTAAANISFAVNDGTSSNGRTSVSGVDGSDVFQISVSAPFSYSTRGSKTWEVVGSASSGTVNIVMTPTLGGERDLTFNIWRSPTQSPRDTVTLETQGWYAEARWTSSSGITFSNVSLSPTTFTDLVGSVSARNTASLKQACATTEAGATMGVSCSGNENLGVVAAIPYAGKYKACFKINTITTPTSSVYFKVINASPTNSAVELQSGHEIAASDTNVTNGIGRYTVCGTLDLNQGETEISLWSREAGAGSTTTVFTDGLTENRSIYFEMYPLTQNFPQAVALTGPILGSTSGVSSSPGYVGEYVMAQRLRSSPLSLTSGITANVLTSPITLTPGFWQISARLGFSGASANVTNTEISVSKTSATFSATDTRQNATSDGEIRMVWSGPAEVYGNDMANYSTGPIYAIVTSTQSYYLVVQANFTAAGLNAYGQLEARRIR